MNNSLFHLYEFISSFLPQKLKLSIGKSTLLKPFRDLLLRSNGNLKIAGDVITFDDLTFFFQGSFKTFRHAKKSGIESRICRFVISECGPGSTCFDVGTNYGFISMVMAQTVKPSGKVLSFECNPDIFKIYKDTVRRNNLETVCEPILNSVGSQPGTTLDEAASSRNLNRVDFIKIDTDGGDYEVLRGAENIIKKFKPVIIVEIMQDKEKIYAFLKQYYPFIAGTDGEEFTPPNWPLNLIASVRKITTPHKKSSLDSL